MKTALSLYWMIILFWLPLRAVDGFAPVYPYEEFIRDPNSIESILPASGADHDQGGGWFLQQRYCDSDWLTTIGCRDSIGRIDTNLAYRNEILNGSISAAYLNQHAMANIFNWEHKPRGTQYTADGTIRCRRWSLQYGTRYWDLSHVWDQTAELRFGSDSWEWEGELRLHHEENFKSAGKTGILRSFGDFALGAGASWFDDAQPWLRMMLGEENRYLLKVEYTSDWQLYRADDLYRNEMFHWMSFEDSDDDAHQPLTYKRLGVSWEHTWGNLYYRLGGDFIRADERYDTHWENKAFCLQPTKGNWDIFEWSGSGRLYGLFWKIAGNTGKIADFDSRLKADLHIEGRLLPFVVATVGSEWAGRMKILEKSFDRYTPYTGVSFYGFTKTEILLAARFPQSDWQGNAREDSAEINLQIQYGIGDYESTYR